MVRWIRRRLFLCSQLFHSSWSVRYFSNLMKLKIQITNDLAILTTRILQFFFECDVCVKSIVQFGNSCLLVFQKGLQHFRFGHQCRLRVFGGRVSVLDSFWWRRRCFHGSDIRWSFRRAFCWGVQRIIPFMLNCIVTNASVSEVSQTSKTRIRQFFENQFQFENWQWIKFWIWRHFVSIQTINATQIAQFMFFPLTRKDQFFNY